MKPCFDNGDCIEFDYRAANYHGVKPRWERRCGVVTGWRDTWEQPLEDATIETDPDLIRDRYLYEIFDFKKREYRHFYAGAMSDPAVLVRVDLTILTEGELAKLVVAVRDKETDEIVGYEFLEDPRASFCKTYNSIMPEHCAVAVG